MNDIGTYLVDTTVNGEPQPLIEVQGRTYVEVERLVRRNLNRDPRTVSFSIDLIREVRYVWSGEPRYRYDVPVVRVVEGYQHQLTINHR
jgi:hypothetical protein